MRWWGALLIATMLLSLAISTRYFVVTDLDASASVLAFRVAMLIGHLTVLCALLLSPALLAALVYPRPALALTSGVLIASLLLLATLVDTQVYQLYRFHINAGVLNLLFGGAAKETFIFPWLMYAEALAIALGVIVSMSGIATFLWRRVQRAPARPRRAATIAGVLGVCIVSFHVTHIWADAVGHEPILEQTAVLPLRYAATAKRFLRARGVRVRSDHLVSANQPNDRTGLAYPLAPLECKRDGARPNIVFVLVDSWRFDALDERITPRVAQFSRRTTRFLDHHSGGNATRIGVFSLFYSIPGTYWHRMLTERQGPVLIEELQRRHYEIRAFRSAPIYSPEFDRTVFADVKLSRVRSQGDGPADWDRDLTDDFLAYLRKRDASSPFFALLFYDAPHSFQLPEDAPEVFQPSAAHVNYLRLSGDTDPTPLFNRYRNSLHYVDSLIGEVLDGVDAQGLLDDTIIVITGDHGQEFNDTGLNFWGHGSNFTRYQTGVPLLLYVPGRDPAVVRHRTTHFDIAPTLLRDHLGCTSDFATFSVGRSLFDPTSRDPLVLSEYSDFAIVQRDRIAVVRKHGMQMLSPDYSQLETTLAPGIAHAAIEQKTRFFKSAGRRGGGDHAQARPVHSVE